MLWLYQRTMFGKIENPKNEKLSDLNMREFATFVPLIILAVWIGLYPAPFLRRLEPAVNRVVARVNPDYQAAPAAGAGPAAAEAAPAGERRGGQADACGSSASDFYYLLPELVLTVGALLVLGADLVLPRARQSVLAALTLAVLGGDGPGALAGVRRARVGRAWPGLGRPLRAVLQGALPGGRGADRADLGALPRRSRRCARASTTSSSCAPRSA